MIVPQTNVARSMVIVERTLNFAMIDLHASQIRIAPKMNVAQNLAIVG